MTWNEGYGRFELVHGRDEFPQGIADLKGAAPKVLYGIGDPTALYEDVRVAVIGAMKCTPFAESAAMVAAREIARHEPRGCLVTGGALGVQKAALVNALDLGVPCAVVLGSGADVAYPKQNEGLFARVLEQGGCILSEQPWGTQPRPQMFPRRNNIIAALCDVMVVVECGVPSGTFSTADTVMRLERRMLAVPRPFEEHYVGANELLKCGAEPYYMDGQLGKVMEEQEG